MRNSEMMMCRRKTGAKAGSGFTLIELLVVIAIIAILAAILFPIFVTAKHNAQKSTCQSNLKQIGAAFSLYLSDFGGVYPWTAMDYYDRWPRRRDIQPIYGWPERLWQYMGGMAEAKRKDHRAFAGTKQVFQCPSEWRLAAWSELGTRAKCSYAMNQYLCDYRYDWAAKTPVHESKILRKSKVILVIEWPYEYAFRDIALADATFYWRADLICKQLSFHEGFNNILYCDGHVKSLTSVYFTDPKTTPNLTYTFEDGTTFRLQGQ